MIRSEKFVTLIFASAIIYQIFHWVEHVSQVYQHWWLELSISHSHGILFFFDLEWNHFVFNTLYFIALIIVAFHASCLGRNTTIQRWGYIFIIGGLGVQAYHQVEHFTKIYQHIVRSCEPCPGILGWFVDGVYLHFYLNTIVLIAPLIAFFVYGYWSKFKKLLLAY